MKHHQLLERAVNALNEEFGTNWIHRIDLDTLDMSCTSRCVLSQLTGTYLTDDHPGRPLQNLSDDDYVLAFSGVCADTITTETWKQKIQELRDASSPQKETPGILDPVEKALLTALLSQYTGPHQGVVQSVITKLQLTA